MHILGCNLKGWHRDRTKTSANLGQEKKLEFAVSD